jgi:hypothetical protein
MTEQLIELAGGEPLMRRDATLSPDGVYRYELSRDWSDSGSISPAMTFIMLNPSTADASIDDPTIRRCIGFARREGYSRLVVLNLYAYRATNPHDLLRCPEPVGPWNDGQINVAFDRAYRAGSPIVVAWGTHSRPERVKEVLALSQGVPLQCLGTTKDGHPKHPLYIRGDQPLIPFGASSA